MTATRCAQLHAWRGLRWGWGGGCMHELEVYGGGRSSVHGQVGRVAGWKLHAWAAAASFFGRECVFAVHAAVCVTWAFVWHAVHRLLCLSCAAWAV
eukprot:8882-Chlamydomonas_euryale.AAC.1